MCRIFIFLVKVIPKYYILFDALINETVFLISDRLWFVEETQLIFLCETCKFAKLVYSCVESLQFSMYKIKANLTTYEEDYTP